MCVQYYSDGDMMDADEDPSALLSNELRTRVGFMATCDDETGILVQADYCSQQSAPEWCEVKPS